jgi:2-keto-4-pentenoate hydratase/2-oxohepta-3-ene-1,7-dioic acid hydratase in catechol pathway
VRLVSFGSPGAEQAGVHDEKGILPLADLLSSFGLRPDDMNAVLGLWSHLGRDVAAALETDQVRIDPATVRLGPPVPHPNNIIGVGRNYKDGPNAGELPQPVLFTKPTTALNGPEDAIVRPAQTETLDYEAELAVVIGRGGRHISRSQAAAHIAGYTVANDVTVPDLMFPGHVDNPGDLEALGLQPLLGKGFDTFAPTGPWVLTADEVSDVKQLEIYLSVNGEERQRGSVRNLVWDVETIVEEVSGAMTLQPGDIILTGTPPGIGWMMDPPRFLEIGDTIEITVDQIGTIRSRVEGPS